MSNKMKDSSDKPSNNNLLLSQIQTLPKEIRNILAGGFAGLIAKTFVAPIDRIKILYQITHVRFRLRNVPKVAYQIIQQEGPTALWKGNTATLLRVFPYAGIQFMSFDRLKSYILHLENGRVVERGLSPVESLIAGSVAGGISVTFTYPLDLSRAQLAVLLKHKDGVHNLTLSEVVMSNYRKRGLIGLFRGVTPSLLGILPYSGVAFAINDQGKRKIRNTLHREPTTLEKLECGALAGLFAQTLTYPLEVTRRRMQTHGVVAGEIAENVLSSPLTKHEPYKATSMINTMKFLYKEQGLKGFFKGVSMNWMKGPIAFSISFTIYDVVQKMLEDERERRKQGR